MRIIGNGFLAAQLSLIADRHPDVLALAAGVSGTVGLAESAYRREVELVEATLVDCRRSTGTLLFFSTASAAVYGDDRPGCEDQPATARSRYGEHKLNLERQVRDSGVDYLILRLSHLVGPRQPEHQLLPTLVRAVLSGRVIVQRQATRDLLSVRHAVAIVDELLEHPVANTVVNVASGFAVPAEAILDRLAARLAVPIEREYVDAGTGHLVCIHKLRELLPGIDRFGFGADYFHGVLDELVGPAVRPVSAMPPTALAGGSPDAAVSAPIRS